MIPMDFSNWSKNNLNSTPKSGKSFTNYYIESPPRDRFNSADLISRLSKPICHSNLLTTTIKRLNCNLFMSDSKSKFKNNKKTNEIL